MSGGDAQGFVRARVPTARGTFIAHMLAEAGDHDPVAYVMGNVSGGAPPLVRIHDACETSVIGSRRCDCEPQRESALDMIAAEKRGVFIHTQQEGRGIGLPGKLRAYAVQDSRSVDTFEANRLLGHPADARDNKPAVALLQRLGIVAVRLMTNNPDKIAAVEAAGIAVQRVPLVISPGGHNWNYYEAKRAAGHLLPVPDTGRRLVAG